MATAGGGGGESCVIFNSAKTGLVSFVEKRDGNIGKIELIVCSEETRPMLKEVARRIMHMTELIRRGNSHFFSMFRDRIYKPYHGFWLTNLILNSHTKVSSKSLKSYNWIIQIESWERDPTKKKRLWNKNDDLNYQNIKIRCIVHSGVVTYILIRRKQRNWRLRK